MGIKSLHLIYQKIAAGEFVGKTVMQDETGTTMMAGLFVGKEPIEIVSKGSVEYQFYEAVYNDKICFLEVRVEYINDQAVLTERIIDEINLRL